MKNIDLKSLIIGALLTSTIIFGIAAAGKSDGVLRVGDVLNPLKIEIKHTGSIETKLAK